MSLDVPTLVRVLNTVSVISWASPAALIILLTLRPETTLILFLFVLSVVATIPLLSRLLRRPQALADILVKTHQQGISMAWRSSGGTNEALVENLSQNSLITTERVKKAMLGVRMILCINYTLIYGTRISNGLS